ncbi:ATP-binding protein [Desulfobacterales bacterium HSG16]|nr:ATP-binding protein [Desulfobacterales bacterium HSG16]
MAQSVSYFINKRNEYETFLKASKIRAEAANRAKSIFLANMSHELRTPLNGILGYARILYRDPTLSPNQKTGLGIIEQSGDHLLSLINDILDLAKIESDKVELLCEDFCLHDLIRNVENIVRIQAERKGIIFELEEPDELPDVVNGDKKRLRQVLLNLLGNAVKFTDAGGVTLKVQNIISDQNRQNAFFFRFEIEDTGIGMSPDNLDRIFEPFQQVGDTDRMGEGTGLGLAISNNLICVMGGKLNVTSMLGQGSCFSFEIVLGHPEAGFEKKISEDARQIIGIKEKKPIILIVDDSQESRNMLCDLLVPIGFTVVLAENGEQGLLEAFLSQPDAVITDLVMPGMNGLELIRRIRLSSELATIPIIAASASAFEEDRKKMLAAGCRAFFPKPLDLNNLLGELKLCLDLQWNYRDIEAASTQDEKSVDILMVFPQADEMEKLYRLTLQGAVNRISDYVEHLENKDIRLKPFAERMYRLLKGFELNRIEVWLESRLQREKEHP